MTDRYDPLPDLAKLFTAALRKGHDAGGYADRIAGNLRLSDDDSPAAAEAELRKALGRDRSRLVTDAARHFAGTWAKLMTSLPGDYDCQLSCAEANAAADLYRALGDPGTAGALLTAHARHRTAEDQHGSSPAGTGSEDG